MNTQQQNNRADEGQAAGSDLSTDVTRSENRQAVANENMHSAGSDDTVDITDAQTRGDSERGHPEGQSEQQNEAPEMNPGHVDQ